MTTSEIILACFGIIFFACFVIVLDQKESALYDLKREKDINRWLRNQKRHLNEMLYEANCKIKELEKPKVNVEISVDAEEFKAKLKEASDEIKEQLIFDKAVSEVCYKIHRGDTGSVELLNNNHKTE